MNHSCLKVLAAAGLWLASSMARADDAEIRYYDIAGNSAQELRREMNSKGPIGNLGERGDGYAKWNLSWRYEYAPAAGGCAFTKIEVTVSGIIILPRWTGEARASSAIATRWQTYLAALRTHEDGHYAHGLLAAEEIRALGQSFRVSGDCSTIAKTFNDQATSIVEKYSAADEKYDSDTGHGRTQGATFP